MAIVNTESSGVVVFQSCIDKYTLKVDDEIEFNISTTFLSTKKKRPVIFALWIEVGLLSVYFPALIMDRLFFTFFLE